MAIAEFLETKAIIGFREAARQPNLIMDARNSIDPGIALCSPPPAEEP